MALLRPRSRRGRQPAAPPTISPSDDRPSVWQVRGREAPIGASRPGRQLARAVVGRCRCGAEAHSTCATGCAQPTCDQHLRTATSRLGMEGPYRSEREHTAYLQGFAAPEGPLCRWCRKEAGVAAIAALPPVPALDGDALECLSVLLRRPHDYPEDSWAATVGRHGGAAALLRRLAPELIGHRRVQSYPGRLRRAPLEGVRVGRPVSSAVQEVIDADGRLWLVHRVDGPLGRGRRVWHWEPAGDDRAAVVLAAVVEEITRARGL